MSRLLITVLLFLGVLASPAFAQQEAKIKQSVESKLGISVTSVKKTAYAGIYEIFFDGQLLYTDDKTSFFLLGNLIDGNSLTNVSTARLGELTRLAQFSDLPLAQAIKQVRGNGKRLLATFEDPNCGYCKKLNQALYKLDNITLYTFLYPILSEDSYQKSQRIWCAKDKAKAWNDWVINGKAPTGSADCDVKALAANRAFGRRLGINGTPTLFFADGIRVSGVLPIDEIEDKMNRLAQ